VLLRHLIVTVVIFVGVLVGLSVSRMLGTNPIKSMQVVLSFAVGALVIGFIWLRNRKL
jgi:hypothetical protein